MSLENYAGKIKLDYGKVKIHPALAGVLKVNGDRFLISLWATPAQRFAMRFWIENPFRGCIKCGKRFKLLMVIEPYMDFDDAHEVARPVPVMMNRGCGCEPDNEKNYMQRITGGAAPLSLIERGGDYDRGKNPATPRAGFALPAQVEERRGKTLTIDDFLDGNGFVTRAGF